MTLKLGMSQAFQICKFQTNGPVNGVKSLPLMILKCGGEPHSWVTALTKSFCNKMYGRFAEKSDRNNKVTV